MLGTWQISHRTNIDVLSCICLKSADFCPKNSLTIPGALKVRVVGYHPQTDRPNPWKLHLAEECICFLLRPILLRPSSSTFSPWCSRHQNRCRPVSQCRIRFVWQSDKAIAIYCWLVWISDMTRKWRPGTQNRLILASFQVQLSAGLEEISITDYPAALASVFQEWPPSIIERSNLCCAFAKEWQTLLPEMVQHLKTSQDTDSQWSLT